LLGRLPAFLYLTDLIERQGELFRFHLSHLSRSCMTRTKRAVCVAWFAAASFSFAPQAWSMASNVVWGVDLMMLYTPAARAAAAPSNIETLVRSAVAEANLVFAGSGVQTRIRLVHVAEIDYLESGSVRLDLDRLRTRNDGFLDAAHALRDQYAADLVCLVTETGTDYSFYGLQGPSADNAFSVTRRSSLNGAYALPVALSFNFGCQLERRWADSAGAFPFSHGYSFAAAGGTFSTAEAFSGKRLPVFSNPALLFNGIPLGIAEGLGEAANNARTIDLVSPIVSAFRSPAESAVPPVIRFEKPAPGSRYTSDTGVPFHVEVLSSNSAIQRIDLFAVFSDPSGWPPLGPHLITAWSDPAQTQGTWPGLFAGDYKLVAVATDSNGIAGVSEPVPFTVRLRNDDFADATVLSGGDVELQGTTFGATAEPGESAVPESRGKSVWYRWTAPGDGRLRLIMARASGFAVFQGDALSNLVQLARAPYPAWTTLEIDASAAVTYHILVDDAYDAATSVPGPFDLRLHFAEVPANDHFHNRSLLTGDSVSVSADTFAATTEPGEPEYGAVPTERSLWWSWTAPATGEVRLSTEGTEYHPDLAVFTGSELTNLTQVLYRVRNGLPRFLTVKAGETYAIAAYGVGGSTGPFALQLQFFAPAVNDNLSNPDKLSGNAVTVASDTRGATVEPGDPWLNSAPDDQHSLWWSWTASASGWVSMSLSQSDTALYRFLNRRGFRGGSLSNPISLSPLLPPAGGLGFPDKA